MKLIVQHPQQENCDFSLSLEYHVPPKQNVYCMGVYDDRKKSLSLHKIFNFDAMGFALPSLLTFESGDKILLFQERELVVSREFTLSVELWLHQPLVFEIVSYFIAGTYLNHQQKDPDFFRAFNEIFPSSKTMSFSRDEIEKYVLETELYGGKIADYFKIEPKTRQIFLDRV